MVVMALLRALRPAKHPMMSWRAAGQGNANEPSRLVWHRCKSLPPSSLRSRRTDVVLRDRRRHLQAARACSVRRADPQNNDDLAAIVVDALDADVHPPVGEVDEPREGFPTTRLAIPPTLSAPAPVSCRPPSHLPAAVTSQAPASPPLRKPQRPAERAPTCCSAGGTAGAAALHHCRQMTGGRAATNHILSCRLAWRPAPRHAAPHEPLLLLLLEGLRRRVHSQNGSFGGFRRTSRRRRRSSVASSSSRSCSSTSSSVWLGQPEAPTPAPGRGDRG